MKKKSFSELWLLEAYNKLKLSLPEGKFTDKQIQQYLISKYKQRRTVVGRFFNNRDFSNYKMSVEEYVNYFLKNDFIISGYNVLFKNHETNNIEAKGVENLLNSRSVFKKMMEASERGTRDYFYYKILQLTYKLLANSFYGILGEKNSIFFNPFIQNSITLTGQDLITNSIMTMEAFFGGNFQFRDMDDFIHYVNIINNENFETPISKYAELQTYDTVLNYVIEKFEDKEKINYDILKNTLSKLNIEHLNQVYYKNNLIKFISNQYFKDSFNKFLKYEFIKSPSEEIKDEFDEFLTAIRNYVFFNRLYENRYVRATTYNRDVITVVDTDSNFISVGKHIEYIKNNIMNYELSEEQDTSLVNIIIYIATDILKQTFENQTRNMGIEKDYRPIINMKQEFLYSRILLTRNKKSYAGIITAELGKPLKEPDLDIKGLAIKKSTLSRPIRKALTDILEEKILKSKKINVAEILKEYEDTEANIYNSMKNGSIEFLIPKNLEITTHYEFPERIDAVRGSLIWNELFPEKTIKPPQKVNLLKLDPSHFEALSSFNPETDDLKTLKGLSKEAEALRDNNFSIFNKIAKVIYGIGNKDGSNISKYGFSVICIPKDVSEIPKILCPFIDNYEMATYNIQNGYILLESLGIYIAESLNKQYRSNVIVI